MPRTHPKSPSARLTRLAVVLAGLALAGLARGQALLAKLNFMPASTKVASPFGDMPIRHIDPAEALDQQDPWAQAVPGISIGRQ